MLVYCIENKINNKRYIGLTSKTLEERFYYHCNPSNSHVNMPIINAIKKYGKDNFIIYELEKCSSEEELRKKEIFWIEKLDTYKKGYNATKGGDGLLGYNHTEETKKKMSESRKGEKNCRFGKPSLFLGKHHTDESKQKISQSNKGDKNGMKKGHSIEAKQKISESQYKKVAMLDDDFKIIKVFNSVIEAAKDVNGKRPGISRVCRGIKQKHRNFRWRYLDKDELF